MERTKLQQVELDKIEKYVLIMFFGQEQIPEPTAGLMTAFNINPNVYIREFENKLLPVMKENGDIDGAMLNKIIRLWKPHIADIINFPYESFRLSENLGKYIRFFLPGIE